MRYDILVSAAVRKAFTKASDLEMEARLQVWLRNHNRLKKAMSASATVSKVEDADDSNDVFDEQDNDDGQN